MPYSEKNKSWGRFLPKISLHSKFFRLLAVLLGLVIVNYLVISDKFLVSDFSVGGNSQVSEEQIKSVLEVASNNRTLLVPDSHILFLSAGRFNRMLVSALPTVKEVVRYKRVFPNRLEFEITERIAGFFLESRGKTFLVDDEGSVMREAAADGTLVKVSVQSEEGVVAGEILPNHKTTAFIVSMAKSWPQRISIGIFAVKLPAKAASEVQFVSEEGWGVFFDTNRPGGKQLDNLALILNRQIEAKDRTRLAYIDLRLEKWIYYCFKDSPCSAEELSDIENTNE